MPKPLPECPVTVMGDYVLLRRKSEEKTKGGIVLPDAVDNPRNRIVVRGEVVASGPGRVLDSGTLKPTSIDAGDIVFFSVQSLIELGEDLRSFVVSKGYPDEVAKELALVSASNIVMKTNT